MEVLLGIILFFVILYYGFKLFLRYVLPWLLGRFVRKQQAKYGQQQNNYSGKREGDVRVTPDKSTKPRKDTGFGEYVDFEDMNEE